MGQGFSLCIPEDAPIKRNPIISQDSSRFHDYCLNIFELSGSKVGSQSRKDWLPERNPLHNHSLFWARRPAVQNWHKCD